jgi:FG-GAP repeat protein
VFPLASLVARPKGHNATVSMTSLSRLIIIIIGFSIAAGWLVLGTASGRAEGSPVQPSFRLAPLPAPVSSFGTTVALSADGSTALVGEGEDAVGVFVRAANGWTEQARLTNPAGIGGEGFGCSVALSADGKTALVGAPGRKAPGWPLIPGAAWVFTREGQTWTLQTKLTPADESNPGEEACANYPVASGFYANGFGFSVALSGDGNTALIGNGADNQQSGAAWVFTRAGSSWTQQGPKLVPSGERGEGRFGTALALSADGNTALIGAPWSPNEGTYEGQAWVFSRDRGTWTQQGGELVLRGHARSDKLGSSVALSGDGRTALIGAEGRNSAWIFGRDGSSWSQESQRLTPEPGYEARFEYTQGQFGARVALASDGGEALVSGLPGNICGKYRDSRCGFLGTVWVLTRVGGVWVRRAGRLTGPGEFGKGLALSSEGATALIGAPTQDSRNGFAVVSTVTPPPPNEFYRGVLTVDRKGVIQQELVSSGVGTFATTATVSSRSLRHLPSLKCHRTRRTRRRSCPREQLVVYGLASATAAGPGVVTLTIHPTRAVRRSFARYRSRSLSVHITISFMPAGGPVPVSQTLATTVEKGRSGESSP